MFIINYFFKPQLVVKPQVVVKEQEESSAEQKDLTPVIAIESVVLEVKEENEPEPETVKEYEYSPVKESESLVIDVLEEMTGENDLEYEEDNEEEEMKSSIHLPVKNNVPSFILSLEIPEKKYYSSDEESLGGNPNNTYMEDGECSESNNEYSDRTELEKSRYKEEEYTQEEENIVDDSDDDSDGDDRLLLLKSKSYRFNL